MQRREVDEGARRGARADLDEFGRDLGSDPGTEHGFWHRPVQRRARRRGGGLPHRDLMIKRERLAAGEPLAVPWFERMGRGKLALLS